MGAILNIILNAIFMPIGGYLAAGYTTLMCYIVFALAHYIFMKKVCKKHVINESIYDEKNILVIAIILTIISLLVMLLYKLFIIRYLIIGCMIILAILKKNFIVNLLTKIKEKK